MKRKIELLTIARHHLDHARMALDEVPEARDAVAELDSLVDDVDEAIRAFADASQKERQ